MAPMQWPDASVSATGATGFEAMPAEFDTITMVPAQGGGFVVSVPSGQGLPCTEDPELFFAEAPADVEAAKALCQGCRARAECLEGALERREPWGVWEANCSCAVWSFRASVRVGVPARTPRVSASRPPDEFEGAGFRRASQCDGARAAASPAAQQAGRLTDLADNTMRSTLPAAQHHAYGAAPYAPHATKCTQCTSFMTRTTRSSCTCQRC